MDYSLPGSFVYGDSQDKNTGVGCHALLQGIFPTQGSKPGLLDCRRILYYLSHQGSHQFFQRIFRIDFLYSGLISFKIDRFDLLTVQGTLKSLLQHHSSKPSILRRSAFFTIQLSHLYMTTGKTIALTTQTFVGKVMSLLFNMLSRLDIAFLPRSKHLLISWLQSPSAVILEPKKLKSMLLNFVFLFY